MLGGAAVMSGLPPELTTPQDHRHGSKVGDLIRHLSSDREVVATINALKQRLEASGVSFHELAEHIEKPNGNAVTEADLKRIYDAGYTQGVQDAENRHHGAEDFLSADGKPTWEGVALFLQRNKNRLDNRHHEFIDDMASRTVWGREPSERQHKYMHSLFHKLGGKIT
jgi:hypothetical protein